MATCTHDKKREISATFGSDLELHQVAVQLQVSEDIVRYWWDREYGKEARVERGRRSWIRQAKAMGALNARTEIKCSVDLCVEPRRYVKTGLCPKHQQRFVKHGDPTLGARAIEGVSKGHLDPSGYRIVWVRREGLSKKYWEHRYVMEQQLGRPLRRDEQVHHLNGDRADNRTGNLELWSTSQPSGQRVEDLVLWARSFVSLYECM